MPRHAIETHKHSDKVSFSSETNTDVVQLYKDFEKTIKAYPKTLATEVYMADGTKITEHLGGGGDPIDLSNYYTKTQTYNKTEVNNLIANISLTPGPQGKSLEYHWRGTELGIRQEGQSAYVYVDLKGEQGLPGSGGGEGGGREIELQKGSTHIQWRYVGEVSWRNLIAISEITGQNGTDGKSLEYSWRGTELGIRQEGQTVYTYTNLKGENGSFDKTTQFPELNTNNKTVIGAINENINSINSIDNHSHTNHSVLETITSEKIAQWDTAEPMVQSDWNELNIDADSYIKNKPPIINDLIVGGADRLLSAEQGKVLNEKLDGKSFKVVTNIEYASIIEKDPNIIYIIGDDTIESDVINDVITSPSTTWSSNKLDIKFSDKYDDVIVNGTELSLKANGVVKKTVTLPSGGDVIEGHTHSNKAELDKFVDGDKAKLDTASIHATSTHAPSTAQRNSDITKEEIEAKLRGEISSHTHANSGSSVEVVDNLASTSTTSALSANQGKILDGKITTLNTQAVKSKNYEGGVDLTVNPNVLTRLDSVEAKANTHDTELADITNDLNSHIQNHPSGGSSVTFRDVVDGEIFELSTTSQPTVNVTEVSLNKTTTIVPTGSTDTLIATVLPSNASNKAVTWTSSNTSIATVNNGVIIGVANGTCTITVTTIDGSKTATCNVTVETVTIPLTSISLKSTSSLTVNATEQLIVIFNPSNATNKSITWSSSDTNKATVVNGLVTAKAEGNVVITATSQDGNKTASCSYTITAIQEGYKLDGLELWVDTKNGSGSDTTLIDKSGKGNDLTLEGFDFDNTTNGWINGGLKFKRTSKITKTNFDGLNCYEKSIEMVFDTAVLSDIQNYLQLKRTSDSKGVALITNASSTTFSASYENTSGSIVFNSNNITGKLKDNTKHHFIMILRSNGDLVGFIDGTKIIFPKSDFSKWIQISPYNLIVGATTYGSTLMTLYQLRIYSNALTDEEALNNYNCYLGGM